MREIKFRGKYKGNEQWIFGYLLQWADRTNEILTHEKDDEFDKLEVIPETVGQFTGLTDKNGVEIYEGDIVKWGHLGGYGSENPPRKAIVEINPDIVFSAFNINVDFSFGNFMYKDTHKWLEVIGNIHDNPELLTTKITDNGNQE